MGSQGGEWFQGYQGEKGLRSERGLGVGVGGRRGKGSGGGGGSGLGEGRRRACHKTEKRRRHDKTT